MSDSTRAVPYGGDILVAKTSVVMDGDGDGDGGATLVYYKRTDEVNDAVRLACVLGDEEEVDEGDPWRDVSPLLDSGLHAFEARVEEGGGWVTRMRNEPSAPALEQMIEKWVIMPLFAASTATRVVGDVEIFTPHRGTNTRWHKDGYLPGCYIGHALISTEGAGEDGDEDADWFEQALVKRDASEDEEASLALPDFGGQESMARGVSVGNFVPIKAKRRGGVLVVFEDAATLHRSPKFSAKSLEGMKRVILRFNFSATDCKGSEVTLFAPPSCVWTPFDERGAVRSLMRNVSSVALAEHYVRD